MRLILADGRNSEPQKNSGPANTYAFCFKALPMRTLRTG
jgi:hypothetical protein